MIRHVLTGLSRYALRLAAGLAAVIVLVQGVAAQSPVFPSKPVTIVVPYAPGGGTDTVARALAQTLGKVWQQSVVVENIPGADGVVGTQKVLRAPADGHTLLLQLNTMLMWKATMPALKTDLLADLKFVSLIQTAPLSFAVSASLPVNTIGEFVSWCNAAATPCSIGSATRYAQLISRHLIDAAGLKNATHVTYKGGAPMLNDVLGGHVTMALPSVASAQGFVRRGQMKILAVGSAERFRLAPTVPTLKESGLQVFGDSWYGLMVARETPPALVAAIVEAVRQAGKDPALLQMIETNGGEAVFSSPQDFDAYVARETKYVNTLLVRYPIEQ